MTVQIIINNIINNNSFEYHSSVWIAYCQTVSLCVLWFPSSRAHIWLVPVPVLICIISSQPCVFSWLVPSPVLVIIQFSLPFKSPVFPCFCVLS